MNNLIFLILIFFLLLSTSCRKEASYPDRQSRSLEEEVIYHVFQHSYFDSDGDRHGDLNGIRQNLDYLEELGINKILIIPSLMNELS